MKLEIHFSTPCCLYFFCNELLKQFNSNFECVNFRMRQFISKLYLNDLNSKFEAGLSGSSSQFLFW